MSSQWIKTQNYVNFFYRQIKQIKILLALQCGFEVKDTVVSAFWEDIQEWTLTCCLIAAASATFHVCFLLNIWSMSRMSLG